MEKCELGNAKLLCPKIDVAGLMRTKKLGDLLFAYFPIDIVSALRSTILHVDSSRTKKQMFWIDAGRIITTMADLHFVRNKTKAFLIDESAHRKHFSESPYVGAARSTFGMRSADEASARGIFNANRFMTNSGMAVHQSTRSAMSVESIHCASAHDLRSFCFSEGLYETVPPDGSSISDRRFVTAIGSFAFVIAAPFCKRFLRRAG